MKRCFIILLCITMIVLTAISAVACVETDKAYFAKISSYSFWDNEGSEAIAQYKFFDIMDGFLQDSVIKDGRAVGADGKTKKVLFVGWDGTRADALTNIFYDENCFETNGYNYEVQEYSGLHRLKSQGGLYMAYAGGEKNKDSKQEPSTCAGFTSELTGGWKTKHGVDLNSDIKSAQADTIMMKYAKLGLNTSFAFDWGQFFDVTLRNDVEYMMAHPDTPMLLRDIDRPKASSAEDIMANENIKKEKNILSKSIDHYNAVAMEKDDIHKHSDYDIAMRDYLIGRVNADDDVVCGIFHCPDTNGHVTGFSNSNSNYVNSVRNANIYLYQMLLVIEERQKNLNEDWLVIVTADHGGSGQGHGLQVLEHRNIWMATNKKVDASFYGQGYDGFNEK